MPIIFNQINKNNDYPAKTPAIIFPFQKNDFLWALRPTVSTKLLRNTAR